MSINAPILAHRNIPASVNTRVPMTFKVQGGLSYIKGNPAPHFSLAICGHRKGFPSHCRHGGPGADYLIEALFPGQFTDLAALRLSDAYGTPMHALENGWFWIAGALGGLGEPYGTGKPPEYCLEAFRKLWRLPHIEDARDISRMAAQFVQLEGIDGAKKLLDEVAKTHHPRWHSEAADCIARHGLVVFGDHWDVEPI